MSVSSPVVSSLLGPHAAAVSGAALFDEECRSDPAFRNRVLGLEHMLRVKAALPETETVPTSKVSGAGVSVLADRLDGACLVPRASPGAEVTFVDGAYSAPRALPGEDTFVYHEHDFVNDAESALGGRDHPAPSTAGESSGISGLHEVSESDSPLHVSRVINSLNSSLGVDMSACACAAAALPAAAAPRSWSTVARLSDAVVAHAHASPMHRACSAGGTGGFLPVQKSTSYCLRNSWSDTVRGQGPTGRRCTKVGVSGPAEDLRPVSEVEAGVNLRPAGGVRGQVAGSIPRRQPGTGTRRVREGAVTPSLHPEVPGIQFVSLGYGLDIRQSMGWTKVCGCVHMRMDMEQLSDRKLMMPSGMALLVCGAGSHPSYHLGVVRRRCQRGVNLNQYAGSGSFIRWHSDNEPLFGPQNAPKLIVSMSLGNSVDFKVRRRGQGKVPSLITLDHGDLLVMDGLTQSEYVHCTASGLQGPRVKLTFRWVAQHIASCPLAGAVGCVLPSCVQGLAEPDPRGDWEEGYRWSSSWGLILLLLILVSVPLVGTLLTSEGGIVTVVSVHPAQWCTSPLGVVPAGLGDGVGHCHDVAKFPRVCLFIFLVYLFGGTNFTLFSRI